MKQSKCSVVPERSAEHGGLALDVETIAAVPVLVVAYVAQHLCLVLRREHLLQAPGHIAGDDQAGHQKHGASIVARPVPVRLLQLLVE
jgi:hypothetical protein